MEIDYRSPLAGDASAGKVAVVTGGGTGIGRATARELARTGARLAICGRRKEPVEAVQKELEEAGFECLAMATDTREIDQVEAFVDATLERFGRIDILINNAGGQFVAPAETITPKGWRAVHRNSVDGTWNMTLTVANRAMIPSRGGVLVFMGFSPRRGIPGLAHASAARSALESLAATLSSEWGHLGIRSVCVSCGPIETEILDSYAPGKKDQWRRSIPLGRLGLPEEVASAIVFLTSAGAGFITGTTLVIDGGIDAWGSGAMEPLPEAEP